MTSDSPLHRDVSDDERKLWREVLIRDQKQPYNSVRVVEAGEQAGLHESRARQIARTWGNDGLVQSMDNGNLVELTEYGRDIGPELTPDGN